jgi:hypothetical protein
MRLLSDWREIVRKAWSIRLILLAALLSGVEVVLPFFSRSMPHGVFAGLSFVAVSGAFVARIMAQRNLP